MAKSRLRKSTIGRSIKWGARRVTAQVLHPLSQPAAASLVARWFLMPERGAARFAPLAGGLPLDVRVGGLRLAARSWGQGPAVVLAHGWSGRGVQLHELSRVITERGYKAVVFDHPGHGDSEGTLSSIAHMADAIEAVCEAVGGAQAIVAHSLGAVATTVALSRGLGVPRVVYVGGPVRPGQYIELFAGALGLPEASRPLVREAVERRVGISLAELEPLALAPSMTAELMLVHDREDREVAAEASEELASVWPGARLLLTRGLGHKRILRDPSVTSAIAAFVDGEPLDAIDAQEPAGAQSHWGLRDPHLASIVEQYAIALEEAPSI